MLLLADGSHNDFKLRVSMLLLTRLHLQVSTNALFIGKPPQLLMSITQ